MNASVAHSWIVLITPVRNVTLPDLDTLDTMLGMSCIVSLLYLLIQLPTVLIGIVLNSISLYIFTRNKSFRQPIYSYLKVTVLASLTSNLVVIVFDLCASRQFVSFSNTLWAMCFVAYVYPPVFNALLFFKHVVDTLLVLDRIGVLKPRLGEHMKLSPIINSAIAFVISIILVSPQYFVYISNKYVIYSNRTGFSEINFVDTSAFSKSQTGKILISTVNISRSVLICLFDITLNLYSMYLFKKYVAKKKALGAWGSASAMMTLSVKNVTRAEHNLARMVIVICLVSVLHQIVVIINFVYVLAIGAVTLSTSVSIFTSNELTNLRHATNFFFVYFFNRNFRNAFKRMICRS
jgi:hypothetical protein